MTDALVQINDRLAAAASAKGCETVSFFCECGDCLAEEVPLSLDEHEEIRVREDLVFARNHDAPRRYRRPAHLRAPSRTGAARSSASAEWRVLLAANLIRVAERA